jgi:hypothetical protein
MSRFIGWDMGCPRFCTDHADLQEGANLIGLDGYVHRLVGREWLNVDWVPTLEQEMILRVANHAQQHLQALPKYDVPIPLAGHPVEHVEFGFSFGDKDA